MESFIIDEITRILLLGALPVVIAAVLGGVAAGLIQGLTSVSDSTIGFAFRLVAVSIALTWVAPSTWEMITNLARRLYGG